MPVDCVQHGILGKVRSSSGRFFILFGDDVTLISQSEWHRAGARGPRERRARADAAARAAQPAEGGAGGRGARDVWGSVVGYDAREMGGDAGRNVGRKTQCIHWGTPGPA